MAFQEISQRLRYLPLEKEKLEISFDVCHGWHIVKRCHRSIC